MNGTATPGQDGQDRYETAWSTEVVRVLRQLGPDVLDQVAVLAGALAHALRELPDAPGGMPHGGPAPSSGSARSTPSPQDMDRSADELPRLVRIEISG